MGLTVVFAVFAGLFALLHLGWVPRARNQFVVEQGSAKVLQSAKLAGLETLRTGALLGMVSTALAAAIALGYSQLGGNTAVEVAASLERLKSLKGTIDIFSLWFGLIATAAIGFGLWRLARAKATQHTTEALQRAISLERDRLRSDREAGRWEELPPTAEMAEIGNDIVNLEGFQAKIDEELAAGRTQTEDGTDLSDLRNKAQERISHLMTEYMAADEYRRMNINWHPPELTPPPPETTRERIQAFFFSRGLLNSLQGLGRVAFVAGALLLIPTMLSIHSESLASLAGEREIKLEELQVTLRRDEAQKSWEQAATKGGPAEQLGEEDERALDQIAAAYERTVAVSLAAVVPLSRAASIPAQLAANRAREAILTEFAKHIDSDHPGARVVTAAERVGPLHADAAATYRHDLDPNKPHTPEGHAFRERVRREVALTSRDEWTKFKRAVSSSAASFARPATAAELEAALVSRIVGLSGVEVAGDGPRARPQGADGIAPETRSRVFDTRSREFMTSVSRTGQLDAAVAATTSRTSGANLYTSMEASSVRSAAARVPKLEDYQRHIQLAPPSLVRNQLAGVDVAAARSSGEKIAHHLYGGTAGARRPIEALHTFDSFFPGHASPDSTPGKGGRATASAGHFSHSRSFVALRGSRRIGGVMIGREADGKATPLDFTAIDWKIEAGRITLLLTARSGSTVTVGPYRAGIAHYALAYAADGRPVTVTMTTAAPLAELKINLHPSLEDTPLGCHAIEIDRFVDTVTSNAPELGKQRENANRLIQAHAALYRLAWSHLVLSNRGSAWISSVHLDIASDIRTRAERERSLVARARDEEISAGLQSPAAIVDPKQSPLSAKPEFFSPLVVEVVAACAKQSQGRLADFDKCAAARAASMLTETFDRFPTWDAPPPDFEQWSGVREMAYSLDPTLNFALTRNPQSTQPLWPFEFLVQIAFSSPPYGASKKRKWYEDDSELDTLYDKQPWEFPMLQQPLQSAVTNAIRSRGPGAEGWADTLEALREFALLQRLFRSAIAGRLGPDFPITRLSALVAATSKFKPKAQRTLRWNLRSGALEFQFLERTMMSMRFGTLGSQDPAASEKAAACLKRFGNASPMALAAVSPEEWDASCLLGNPAGRGSAASQPGMSDHASYSALISEARRLRRALRVEDERAHVAKRCMPAS